MHHQNSSSSFNRNNSDMPGASSGMNIDESGMDGDKSRNGNGMTSDGKQYSREYIDYDDPTQFDGQGQRIAGAASAAQT